MAKATYNNAKIKAESAKRVLKLQQANVENLREEFKNAAFELNKARLQLHLANERFNNTAYTIKSIQSSECEIKDYTCLNRCVIPDVRQEPVIIPYNERYCKEVEKTIIFKVWR